MAELQIPAIGVDQFVVSGTDATELSKGPGHYVGTAVPGQAGNVAIAGHRTTNGAPFNRLGQLVRGDRIILTTTSGEHLTYVVSGTPQAVSPSDVAVLNYFGDNRITLTTCTPGVLRGATADRRGDAPIRRIPQGARLAAHVPRGESGHRQLGLVVASGGRTRALPLGAARALLPAL